MKNSLKKFQGNYQTGDIKHCEKCGSPTEERNVIKVIIGGSELEYFLCVEHAVQLMCIMGKVLEDYMKDEMGVKLDEEEGYEIKAVWNGIKETLH